MKDWLQRFMIGRYGMDQLSRAMFIASLVCLAISWLGGGMLFGWLALLGMIFADYRMLSRQIARRQQENYKYMQATAKLRKEFQFQQRKWKERKSYLYFKCPYCKAHLRLPLGKGRVMVRCNKCGREFEKVS